jgi:hypothetical protein
VIGLSLVLRRGAVPVHYEERKAALAKSEGKKGRKLGRNKTKCERYRARGTREAAKRRRAEQRERWLKKRRAAKVAREIERELSEAA